MWQKKLPFICPVTPLMDLVITQIWCHLLGGDEDQDFYIEKNTGSIVIARQLDAGKRSNYNLTVSVTDGFQTITTQVISCVHLVWRHYNNSFYISPSQNKETFLPLAKKKKEKEKELTQTCINFASIFFFFFF